MVKDDRLYAKFTEDFCDHPKIKILSDAAFRCLVEAILWSRQQLTDGFLSYRYAVARWSLAVLQELCENDTEKPSLKQLENGFLIHDFAEHQTTRAEIEYKREVRRQAGKLGGLAKARNRATKGLASAKQNASKRGSKTYPETETETEPTYVSPNGDTSVGARARTHAPPTCPRHGDDYDHDEPCRHCQRRREYDEHQAARIKHNRDEAIRKCGRCDNTGKYGLDDGTFIRCNHGKQPYQRAAVT